MSRSVLKDPFVDKKLKVDSRYNIAVFILLISTHANSTDVRLLNLLAHFVQKQFVLPHFSFFFTWEMRLSENISDTKMKSRNSLKNSIEPYSKAE